MYYSRVGSGALYSVVICLLLSLSNQQLITDEAAAWRYLEEYSITRALIMNNSSKLSWAYATNITEENQQRVLERYNNLKPFYEEVANNASMFDFENFGNSTLKKVFKDLANKGWAALPDEKFSSLNRLNSDMETIYSEAKICKAGSDKKYSLEPELTEILASSRDYDELLWVWKNWRDHSGKLMREKYLEFVGLSNEAARLNGYNDTGEGWRQGYAAENFDLREDLERIYGELEPFYTELHTYVREKLKQVYGEDKFPASGHIPAHLLGNMWAQSWGNLEDLLIPFNGSKPINATPALQNMTVRDMFNMSDEFFVSLGLEPATPEFWERSMLEKPADGRDVVCHASAWDFNDGSDFRIKQCTRKNMEDFTTVHHEMGHIQYYLQYKDLLYPFRNGANGGFHEAVGDVMALSVATPKHLKAVGLIESYNTSNEDDINYLLSIALDKIVFLPFGKLMDDFRWALFAGEIDETNLNAGWWSRRCKYQGLSPPVERTEEDFDPGAKFHIPANVPYVRYLVSYILQFQFHKALCDTAGHTGPLHTCDIYQSRAAGSKLGAMLKLGSSKEWPEALAAVTGSPNMSADAIVEYFQPLKVWLQEYNDKSGATRGWEDQCPEQLPKASTAASGICESTDNPTPDGNPSTDNPTTDGNSATSITQFTSVNLCAVMIIARMLLN